MTTLTQSNGYIWDLDDYYGSVSNGTIDAYDGGMNLLGYAPGTVATFEDSNREMVFAAITSGQVTISRKVYVPDTGTGLARYLEIVTNTGTTATTFNVGITSYLGSDGATAVLGTSSGDTAFTTADRWIITDDGTGVAGGDPVVAHVFGSAGGLAPTSVSQTGDQITYNFGLNLAAGQTKIIMHFGVQANTLTDAQSTINYIQGQPSAIFSGMSSQELAQLANYTTTVINSTYAISPASTSKAEGNTATTPYTITVTRTGNTSVAGTVDYVVAGTGSAAADAADFSGNTLPSGTVSFAAGQTSKTVTIQINADTTHEASESFSVILQNATAGQVSTTQNAATATIVNDDLRSLTSNDDFHSGTLGADSISGMSGDDTISGLEGNDVLIGATGDDVLNGGSGNDTLGGSSGDDTIVGGSGNDVLYGGSATGWSSGDETQTSSASGTIPSTGQTLAISLNAPTDTATGSVTIDGLVSRSTVSSNQFNIVYVVDRSGSMSSSFSGTETVPDMNGNGSTNELMDAAIKSFESLNTSLISGGFSTSRLGIVEFGNSSGGASIVYNGQLAADSNGDGVSNAATTLRALTASGGTPYDLGLQQAISFFQTAPAGNNIVFFISDGAPDNTTSYQDEVATLLASNGINATMRAIGLGSGASLTALDLVDDYTANNSAVRVTTPSQLTSGLIAPPVSSAEIARVEILKGTTVVATIQGNQLVSTPLGLKYTATVTGLTDASTTLTARVVASDTVATKVSSSLDVGKGQYNDYLYGGSGNDILYGSSGGDLIDGGSGIDTVSYTLANGAVQVSLLAVGPQNTGNSGTDTLVSIEHLYGSAFNDTLAGSSENNLISGFNGNDLISGGAGNDTLSGGNGNDTLYGEAGTDSLVGGAGDDTYVVNITATAGLEDVIVETSSIVTEIDTLKLAGTSSNTTTANISLAASSLVNLEHLDVSSTGSSLINLTGNSTANRLTGNSASNTLDGGAGIDTLTGGDGSDYYYVRDAGDIVTETNAVASTGGTDLVYSYISSYTLTANVENGRILTTAAANLTGNNLSNVIYAGAGNNVLSGGAGAEIDTVSYANGLLGTTGVTVDLSSGAAQATVGSGSDTLSKIENVIGSAYADKLTGSSGTNVLTGGAGADILKGNGGNDIFDFNTLAEMGTSLVTWDVISDFNFGDKIDLSTLDANTATTTNDAFNGTMVTTFTAAGQLKLLAGVLYGNTDANLATHEFAIQLTGVNALIASDFVL